MADEGSTGHAGAGLTAVDHHDTAAHHMEQNVMRSRKSTWNKDITDINVSGTQTPMSVNRLSRLEPGLEDYFVRASQFGSLQVLMNSRLAQEISTNIPSCHISCECMEVFFPV